jgi:hypothetical protein
MVSGTSLSSGVTLLLEYIKPVEAHAVWYEIIPVISSKTTRGGVMVMTPNNGSAADIDGLIYLRKQVNEWMAAYKGRLKDFLDNNSTSYPDYAAACKDNFFAKNNSQGFLFY